MLTKSFSLYILVAFIVTHSFLNAQTSITRGVIGAGVVSASSQESKLKTTFGQSITGLTASGENISATGFWYQHIDIATSVEHKLTDNLPVDFLLEQNYPNPFNPTTTVRFTIPKQSHIRLQVFDLQGRNVAILIDDEMTSGFYDVTFEAQNLPSGLYFYRLTADGFIQTRKLTLIK